MRPGESFVEQPIRSLQTMLRVIAEDDARLPTLVPDGVYGPTTMQAVSAFQRQYGLPVTGITDQATWDQIVAIYEPALIRIGPAEPIEILMEPGEIFRLGDSNAYIYLLQSILTQLANDNPTISPPDHNGVLDDPTSQALAAFQLLAGLPPTGELDKITWKYLVRQFTLSANRQAAER
ncbi:MAG: peptidoglycan-binding protein [Oscillospiraceae bacterium]|nr:peptidoglycan-binding protein [Oscillospiraceae bacterium]MBQ8881102.1 peptidoglycan-binding protein [Oscillospiraceae bacterium]